MKPMKAPSDFDVNAELSKLKAQTKTIRKRRYTQRKSKLDPYHGEIIQLLDGGASGAEIRRWLRGLNVEISPSTLSRWIERNHSNG